MRNAFLNDPLAIQNVAKLYLYDFLHKTKI